VTYSGCEDAATAGRKIFVPSNPLFSPMKRAGLFSIPEAKRQLGKSQNPCFSSFPTATAEQEMPVFC